MTSFRRRGCKLIKDEIADRLWVYDLVEDPDELHPLKDLDAPLAQAIVRDARLAERRLNAYRSALSSETTRSSIPPQILEKLESLGYVGAR